MSQEVLITAIINGDVRQVKYLLNVGVDPDGVIDRAKVRPLHFALQEKHPEIVQALLNAGADVDLTDIRAESARDIVKFYLKALSIFGGMIFTALP